MLGKRPFVPKVRLFISVALHRSQSAVYGTENLSKSDVIRGKGEYVMMESLVVEEVHGIVHGGGNVESRGNNVVGMRFKGIQINLGRRQMVENANETLSRLVIFIR